MFMRLISQYSIIISHGFTSARGVLSASAGLCITIEASAPSDRAGMERDNTGASAVPAAPAQNHRLPPAAPPPAAASAGDGYLQYGGARAAPSDLPLTARAAAPLPSAVPRATACSCPEQIFDNKEQFKREAITSAVDFLNKGR